MNLQKIILPILGALLVVAAWRAYGWGGVAIAAGGIVMWALLHFTRLTHVLTRASKMPVGYVASAVMLNAKLKSGVSLLHVIAMTQALGEPISAKDEQPEVYRWTDGSGSHVTCEFVHGKLAKWVLSRPPESDESAPEPAP